MAATFQKKKKKDVPLAAEKGVSEVKIRNVCKNPGPINILGEHSTLGLCLTEGKEIPTIHIIRTFTFKSLILKTATH